MELDEAAIEAALKADVTNVEEGRITVELQLADADCVLIEVSAVSWTPSPNMHGYRST